MGCSCSKQEAKAKPAGISKDQQAKVNETTAVVAKMVAEDVKAAIAEAEDTDAVVSQADMPEEEKKAMRRKLKKARKRATKLETLEKAREVEALSLQDYNSAIRRLQSVTGEDPTNPDAAISLPEGLDWLNTILETLWPSIKRHASGVVRDGVDTFCRQFSQWYGANCRVEEFIFDRSDAPCGFGPISTRKVPGMDGTPDGSLEISLGITYRSSMLCSLETDMGQLVVQNFDFLGTMFIYLRPFIDEAPLLGGLQFAFANQPTINLDYSGFVGEMMTTMASVRDKVRQQTDYILGSYCVMPYFYHVPLHPKYENCAKLKCPEPEGMVRLTLVDATNFPDRTFGGGFDVFLDVSVGMAKWRSKTVKNTRQPEWNESHDFLVYNQDQWICVKVYDENVITTDSVIGEVLNLPVNRLVKRGVAEIPLMKDGLPLFGAADDDGESPPPCTLRLRAEWVAIKDDSPAAKARLVSTHVKEIADLPEAAVMKKLKMPGPYKAEKAETWGGTPKPGEPMKSEEALRLIRELHAEGKSYEVIKAVIHLGGDGGDAFLDAALEKTGGKWALANDDADHAWWKTGECHLNWRTVPRKQINDDPLLTLWARAAKDAPALASDDELDRREVYFKKYTEVDHWHYNVAYQIYNTHACAEPYFEHILHLNTTTAETVTLNVYCTTSGALVGTKTMKVEDTKQGDEPDLVGPFAMPFKVDAGLALTVHGSVTVKALEATKELPKNWNLKADSIDRNDFMEWWKDEIYSQEYFEKKLEGDKWLSEDWPKGKRARVSLEEQEKRVKFYEGGTDDLRGGKSDAKTLVMKEAALMRCLRHGALTWGDYDCIVARLRGEPDAPAIAETLDWVNMVLECMWPSIKGFTNNLVRNDIEPQLKQAVQDAAGAYAKLASFDVNITKFDLGTKPPFFNTIQVVKQRGPNAWGGAYKGFRLHLNNISLVSDVDLAIEVVVETKLGITTRIPLGLKDLLFRASVEVDCGPMLPEPPFIGCLRVTLPNLPELDFDLTGAADVVDKIPGIKGIAVGVILDNIGAACVAPNFMVTPLARGIDHIDIQYPRPIGVLRVECRAAHNLMAGDVNPVTGYKGSDAYVKVRVSQATFCTEAVTSLDPVWEFNNVAYFPIHSLEQKVQFEVFDADGVMGGADDTLGGVHSKETVLGGGVDTIHAGIPVRALLRLGSVNSLATLPLTRKVKDEVSSSPTHLVYEEVPVIGESKVASSLSLAPEMLQMENDGNYTIAYMVDCRLDGMTGLPSTADVDLCGPYNIKVASGNHTATTKSGVGKTTVIDGRSCINRIKKLATEEKVAPQDIAKLAHLSVDLVTAVLKRAEESPQDIEDEDGVFMKQWVEEANKSKQHNADVTAPRFDQRLYVILPVDKDDERAAAGRIVLPVTLTVMDKFGRALASHVIDYDIQANTDEHGQTQPLHGPWEFTADVAATETGLLDAIGLGAKAPPLPAYKGTWVLNGQVDVDPLRQRILDAD